MGIVLIMYMGPTLLSLLFMAFGFGYLYNRKWLTAALWAVGAIAIFVGCSIVEGENTFYLFLEALQYIIQHPNGA